MIFWIINTISTIFWDMPYQIFGWDSRRARHVLTFKQDCVWGNWLWEQSLGRRLLERSLAVVITITWSTLNDQDYIVSDQVKRSKNKILSFGWSMGKDLVWWSAPAIKYDASVASPANFRHVVSACHWRFISLDLSLSVYIYRCPPGVGPWLISLYSFNIE